MFRKLNLNFFKYLKSVFKYSVKISITLNLYTHEPHVIYY